MDIDYINKIRRVASVGIIYAFALSTLNGCGETATTISLNTALTANSQEAKKMSLGIATLVDGVALKYGYHRLYPDENDPPGPSRSLAYSIRYEKTSVDIVRQDVEVSVVVEKGHSTPTIGIGGLYSQTEIGSISKAIISELRRRYPDLKIDVKTTNRISPV